MEEKLVEALTTARAAVAELVAAVDAEAAMSSHEVVDDAVIEACGLCDAVAVAATGLVGEWEARGRYRMDGSRSAVARLARDTGWSRVSAGRLLGRGRFTRCFSETASAFRAGELSADKVDVLARAVIVARRGLFSEAEHRLLSDARRLGCDDLARAVRYWADCADDQLGRDRSRGQMDNRRLSTGQTLDGSTVIDARLDPVTGAVFTNELDRLTQQLFEDDWATARAEHGDAATAADLVRTASQRRVDALRIMATRSAAMPADSRVPRPLFSVLIDPTTARRICQLANGTPLSPGALAAWITAADVERAIFDGPTRVIELGQRVRFFRGGLRRAIELRDQHCTFPGCDIPAERCDVDHIIEHVDGGPTTQANGRLRCPGHNRQRPGRRTRTTTNDPDP